MAKNKVFVGSLSWDTDDAGLRDHFSDCGEITEAKVVTDRYTGRSRGFGFVTFASTEGATNALELNGQPLDGRDLQIDYAHDKDGGGRSDDGREERRW